MLFSSIFFLFYFLPITLGLYYVIPAEKRTARNVVLLVASLLFYSWGEPVYVVLMLYSAFFNYYMALLIQKDITRGRSAKGNLVFAVFVNLLMLGFFKYFGLLMDTFNDLTGLDISYTALALPIGISFYTFQAMSYVFDVYYGKVKAQRAFPKFLLYLSFFPQLIAGPIVKYRDVELQIDDRVCTPERFGLGAKRFLYGLGKKVLLANNLGALYAEIGALPDDKVSVLVYWIGIAAYSFQIYFDFSGYSDMAIGLGRMFGFEFNENFNYPYISKTVTEFWRRWHMSLSTWFREYVYFPLGGSRVTVPRHILNLLIVWALTGLWHGANWNFVLWGMYYGVLLILEKYIFGKYLAKTPAWIQHLYCILAFMVGWVFFSITDIGDALHYLSVLFGGGPYAFANMTTLYYIRTNILMLLAAGFFSTPYPAKRFETFAKAHPRIGVAALFGVLVLAVAYLVFGAYNPFLYFRF